MTATRKFVVTVGTSVALVAASSTAPTSVSARTPSTHEAIARNTNATALTPALQQSQEALIALDSEVHGWVSQHRLSGFAGSVISPESRTYDLY